MPMTSFRRATWFKIFFLGLINAIAIIAFALNRTVTIPGDPTKGITLLNSSTSPVTYDLKCHATDGVPGLYSTNLVLPAKASTNISYLGTSVTSPCTTGSTNAIYGGSNMTYCTHTTGYAYAAATCGAGWNLCTVAQWSARKTASTEAWLSTEGFNSTFSTDEGFGYTDRPLSDFAPISRSSSNSYCATGQNGSGTTYQYCGSGHTNTGYGSLCCRTGAVGTAIATASCEVTVRGSGYLQSPEFKGNTPF